VKKIISMALGAILCMAVPSAVAAQGPVEKFSSKLSAKFDKNCEKDLMTYCLNVTPGEGRAVACLYAHSDKISTPCLATLYEEKGEIKNAVDNANTFIADSGPTFSSTVPK